jgi:hypothetical protein
MKTKLIRLLRRIVESPLLSRAFHTFVQAFLAVWLTTGFKLDKVTLIAALAAGISAVKTTLVTAAQVVRS